ncbi:MAG: hypothetical protein LUG91_09770 [Ruminococcus sp.]|nr:hypothetical protein [Ruminococcus sp.]
MSDKTVKIPEDIQRAWDDARICATLIREGKARIEVRTRKDGSTCRYTKLRSRGEPWWLQSGRK